MQKVETRENEALPVLVAALGFFFCGAMYGMTMHLHRRLP
jgi:hypothetical protein